MRRLRIIGCLGSAIAAASGVVASAALANTAVRVSVAANGSQANDSSFIGSTAAVSADGRYVVFTSSATNLVADDTNGVSDAFVRDTVNGTTERASVSSAGAEADGETLSASISADGRYVAFSSRAGNLVAGDTNDWSDVFVRDRVAGTTRRVSVSTLGVQSTAPAGEFDYNLTGAISSDGRFVVFSSLGAGMVPGDANGFEDVFVHDLTTGTTELIGSAGANGPSGYAAISAEGRFVTFASDATNLAAGDTNDTTDVFLEDRSTGVLERITVSAGGAQADGTVSSVSADGRYVAFQSGASTLVPDDTNSDFDVFVRDRATGTTTRASVSSSGAQGEGGSIEPVISTDGRYVAFTSNAPNLVANDSNGQPDIFVRDLVTGSTTLVSVSSSGRSGNDRSQSAALSPDGGSVAFTSLASNLVPGDTNRTFDVFLEGDAATSSYACAGQAPTILGTPGNDMLIGSTGSDVIVALGGDDVIRGRGGKDIICAGPGDDLIRAGSGSDHVQGGVGSDTVWGGYGNDVLRGYRGDDALAGQAGNDLLAGGRGDDTLNGGRGMDRCLGGPGVDAAIDCESEARLTNTPHLTR